MVLRVGLGVQSLFLEALRPVEPFRRENEKRSSLVRHLQVIQLLLAKCAHDHALNRWLISFADVQMMLPGLSANRPTVRRLFNLFFLFLYSKKLAKITKAAVAWWAFFCSVPHVPMRALIRQGEATWTSTSSSSCCTTDFPFFLFFSLVLVF